jgi:hypothetical protein
MNHMKPSRDTRQKAEAIVLGLRNAGDLLLLRCNINGRALSCGRDCGIKDKVLSLKP